VKVCVGSVVGTGWFLLMLVGFLFWIAMCFVLGVVVVFSLSVSRGNSFFYCVCFVFCFGFYLVYVVALFYVFCIVGVPLLGAFILCENIYCESS
jgi:hypothetical protein